MNKEIEINGVILIVEYDTVKSGDNIITPKNEEIEIESIKVLHDDQCIYDLLDCGSLISDIKNKLQE